MGNIPEFVNSDKGRDFLIVLLIVLVGLASFGLGRLSAQEYQTQSALKIEERELRATAFGARSETASATPVDTTPQSADTPATPYPDGKYVASKHGSAYHFPWCPGAKRISDKNLIWFASSIEAEQAGYRKAANCQGL